MDQYLRNYLPYCLQRLSGNRYVLLNRNYRQIALSSEDWWADDDQLLAFEIVDLTPEIAVALSVRGKSDTDRIYFFDDGSAPWNGKRNADAFEKRLERLRMLDIRFRKGRRDEGDTADKGTMRATRESAPVA